MKIAVTGLLLTTSLLSAADWKIVERYPLPGAGGWDYVTVDSAARRVYISHSTQVEVVDADNGKLIGTISDTPGVHGVAIAPGEKHGFTSNGREDKVSMFEPQSLKLIRKIDVGKGPDGIWYDAATNRVFTNNHGSHDISAIDAKTGEVVGTVKLAGDGEQAIKASDGLYYVNSENIAEVVAFDPKSLEIKHRFPIGVAETPTGLAYDAKTSRLFIACRKEPKMVVMDLKTGKVIGSFPIGTGADWAEFDASSKTVLVSTGQGVLNTFREKSADAYEDAGTLTTQTGAKTMGIDAKTNKIFLPAAEYDMKPNADPAKPPVRTMKPGSFVLLVVSK